jgi:hypothetical protein
VVEMICDVGPKTLIGFGRQRDIHSAPIDGLAQSRLTHDIPVAWRPSRVRRGARRESPEVRKLSLSSGKGVRVESGGREVPVNGHRRLETVVLERMATRGPDRTNCGRFHERRHLAPGRLETERRDPGVSVFLKWLQSVSESMELLRFPLSKKNL